MEMWGGCRLMVVVACVLISPSGITTQVISPGRRTENFAPRIVEQPVSSITVKGDPAKFVCKAEGRPEPEIQWYKDGQPLQLNQDEARRSVLDSGSTLFFLQVIGSRQGGQDGGVYQCVARNSLGTAYSSNATLEIAYMRDEFKQEPESAQLTSGDSAVLLCTPPRGYPTPEVTWFKDDEEIVPDNIRVKIAEDGNLLMKDLRKDDEGTYKCEAHNLAGRRISREATLTIQVKPSFINPPQDTITAPGEAVVLRCEVEGDPTPTVSWSREIGELPAGRYQIQADNSLRIRHTEELDDGIYICTASNIWGTSNAQARLRVSAVPDFIRAPRDRTVHVDQVARFQCEAFGSPPPSIHWQIPGTEDNLLFVTQVRGRFGVSSSGELQISPVRMEDAGRYVCYATGGTGVAEASAVLRVIAGTGSGSDIDETLAPPPIILYGPANQTLAVGSTATFRCTAAGIPAPTLHWTRDGTQITYANSRFTHSDNQLRIASIEMGDSGLYSCLATNSSGQTTRSATLTVIESSETPDTPIKVAPSTNDLPNPPSRPLRVNVTRTSIQIRWSAPSASRAPSVTGYQVEYYSPEQTTGWVEAATGVQGETRLVTHLFPASSYMFVVRAINANGFGLPSPISETITTLDDTTLMPPPAGCLTDVLASSTVEITTVTPLSPTAIKVAWEMPQNEDQIDGYQVRYRLSSGERAAMVQQVVGMTSTILTGLDPGMDYTVSVRTEVCGRAGLESSAMATKTLDEGSGPQCPSGVNNVLQNKLDGIDVRITSTEPLGPNAIQVKWEIARYAAYVDGFHIKYRPIDAAPSAYSIETITGQPLLYVLNGLLSWKEYVITVRPFNGLYCGMEGGEVTARTGADIPRGAPQNVNARHNGTNAILVSWRAPAPEQVHGYIKGYHISCRGNATSQQRNRTIQGNVTFVAYVSGLEPGKMYRVQVAAFTSAGLGPSSSVINVALPASLVAPIVKDPDDNSGVDGGEGSSSVASEPWFYGIIAGIVLVIALVLIAYVLRRRKLKHAENLTKRLEGATHMTTLTSQYDGQPTSNGHPSWPPDQTWRSNNSSDCQSSSLHESKDQIQPNQAEKGDLSTCKSDHYNRNNVPVYAVVDNESEDDEESPSCPHMAHTLPLNQCNHMLHEHCQSLPPHMTEPYASTTLVLPPNIREYMAAQRQNCSDTSSGSASGSITYPLPSAGQQKGRKKAGKKGGRPGEMEGGPPLPPQRDGSHLCADCQSGLSDSGTSSHGSRRKGKVRPGTGGKYPASNWTEFLPPPPEEPPMGTDPSHMHPQNSLEKIKPPPPCSSHSGFMPIQPAVMGVMHPSHQHHHAPALPMRQQQHHPQHQVSYPFGPPCSHPHAVQSSGLPHTLPVVSRGEDHLLVQPHSSVAVGHPASTVPPRSLMNGQYPMGVVQGVQPLAPHQVFEDPRHEQLGRELLEFNDDLMSQSEVMSDNEEVTPMLPRIGANTGLQDQSSKLIPEDLETDLETSSNCTGSMLASWASMNGSSTGGSNRNSATSCSSDGSFCAETDFASAVTAAAHSAGIPVVGSPPADCTKVGRDLEAVDLMGNGSAKQTRRMTPSSRKGPAIPTSLFAQQVPHRVPATSDPYHNHHHSHSQQHQQHQMPLQPSQRTLPPPPSADQHGDLQQDSLNKNKRRGPPTHDNLFLRDTNDLGLTVTANPMAFAHEEEESFNS